MNLLCIAVDRLHVGYLGCYGNTWIATPTLDRLASRGFVFDQAHVDTLDLAAAYDSWWRGTHVLARNGAATANPTWAELARSAGLRTLLATDEPTVLDHAAGAAFDDALELPSATPVAEAASDAAATHTARSFAAVNQRLAELTEPFGMWFHTAALAGPWDAPAEFRERYRDEEDPPAPTFTALASQTLPDDVDLDERFALSMAYGAQVTLLDVCLGGLLEHLEETGLDERTAVVVCGVRGLALGEHQHVGFDDERLFAENVHVPCIVRLPQARGRLRRSQALIQPGDLPATIAELLNQPAAPTTPGGGRSLLPLIDGTARTVRDRAAIVGRSEIALRTPRWMLRAVDAPAESGGPAGQLFVKPDDFWEVNDVADRCPEAVDELRACYDATAAAWAEGREPPPLPDVEEMLSGDTARH